MVFASQISYIINNYLEAWTSLWKINEQGKLFLLFSSFNKNTIKPWYLQAEQVTLYYKQLFGSLTPFMEDK